MESRPEVDPSLAMPQGPGWRKPVLDLYYLSKHALGVSGAMPT